MNPPNPRALIYTDFETFWRIAQLSAITDYAREIADNSNDIRCLAESDRLQGKSAILHNYVKYAINCDLCGCIATLVNDKTIHNRLWQGTDATEFSRGMGEALDALFTILEG